ncbi:MAG: hypothetical protein QM477_10655 [Planctomycetota bacterium]
MSDKQSWTWQAQSSCEGKVLHFTLLQKGTVLSFASAISALQSEEHFRNLLIQLIAESPFSALRWETPEVSNDLLERKFEFVLLDSPYLDVPANPRDFAEYFRQGPEVAAVAFPNLGHDGIMIAPCPQRGNDCYAHLAAFSRNAAKAQQHAFWQLVGKTMQSRVSAKPVWLSTAGGGVDWLHVRLDDRPKYYAHLPFAKDDE